MPFSLSYIVSEMEKNLGNLDHESLNRIDFERWICQKRERFKPYQGHGNEKFLLRRRKPWLRLTLIHWNCKCFSHLCWIADEKKKLLYDLVSANDESRSRLHHIKYFELLVKPMSFMQAIIFCFLGDMLNRKNFDLLCYTIDSKQ